MFHFTIRDLLWLTVMAALGVGWWLERFKRDYAYEHAIRFEHTKRVEAEEKLDRLHTRVLWQCGFAIGAESQSAKSPPAPNLPSD